MSVRKRIKTIEWQLHDLIYNRVNLHARKLFELEECLEKLEEKEKKENEKNKI